jgi:hypothetical protein
VCQRRLRDGGGGVHDAAAAALALHDMGGDGNGEVLDSPWEGVASITIEWTEWRTG